MWYCRISRQKRRTRRLLPTDMTGRNSAVTKLTRRSVIRGSLGLAAAAGLARPYIANAAAKTATVWWVQGFAQEEDIAFQKLIADYEKASGNTIELSIAPLERKST